MANQRTRNGPSTNLSERFLLFTYWLIAGAWKRVSPRARARLHSNQTLREYLKFLGGDVINVSGWIDSDKQGSTYRDYFGKVKSYTVSNIEGHRGMPENRSSENDWIMLNLESSMPVELKGKFDVV